MPHSSSSNDTKRCWACTGDYPRTAEYFHRKRASGDGLQNICKECQRERMREYQREHPKENRERTAKYFEEHVRSDPKRYEEFKRANTEHQKRRYRTDPNYKAYCLQNAKKRDERVKADPVLKEQRRQQKIASSKRYYERIKADPVLYEEHLKRTRTYVKQWRENIRATDPERYAAMKARKSEVSRAYYLRRKGSPSVS